jgi:putative hydrolase of the HAD superfamily
MLRYLLCDLDETLYGPETGLWVALRERISQYMINQLGLPPETVPALRESYYHRYGTSLTGLQHDYQVDAHEYLAYVHDLPLADYLQPSPALNGMLARLPLQKIIFTNADAPHAQRVLDQLGIARHFSRIIDIHTLEGVNQPQPEAYARALQLLGAKAGECLFADDALRNLLPAHDLGMLTVLVGGEQTPPPRSVDYHIPNILGLERVVAGLFGQVH